MRVDGRVMVVTGAGAGIGREVVRELLRRGARVAAVDLRQEGLDGTVRSVAAGDRLATFAADVTDRAAVEALPAAVTAALGPPDGLINVAGIIQPFVTVAELDEATIARVLDVNLQGVLHTVRAFLPGLRERPQAHLVNVASMGAFVPVPGQSVYGASKAAVRALTEGLYAELRDTRVGVSVVLPGGVRTDITANSGVEAPGGGAGGKAAQRLLASPEAAARGIVDGIEEGRLHVLVGKDAAVLWRLSRLAPRRTIHLIQRQMARLTSS